MYFVAVFDAVFAADAGVHVSMVVAGVDVVADACCFSGIGAGVVVDVEVVADAGCLLGLDAGVVAVADCADIECCCVAEWCLGSRESCDVDDAVAVRVGIAGGEGGCGSVAVAAAAAAVGVAIRDRIHPTCSRSPLAP